jgi:hypothetical protein
MVPDPLREQGEDLRQTWNEREGKAPASRKTPPTAERSESPPVGEPKPMPSTPGEEMPSTPLSVEVRPYGNGWKLKFSNQVRGYTWTNCVARIGGSIAKVTDLEPLGAVVLNRSDFTPPVLSGSETLELNCTINGKVFEGAIVTSEP